MDLSKMRARTKMRTVAGHSIARQNQTSKAFTKAEAEAKNAPYAGESGIDVEGNKPKPRLDRPARASGGRVCRADGGVTLSEDSKKMAAKLREDASDDQKRAIFNGGVAAMLGGLTKGSKVGKALFGANALMAGTGALSATGKRLEAREIERGRAEEGKEDRKRGGRVARDKDCD